MVQICSVAKRKDINSFLLNVLNILTTIEGVLVKHCGHKHKDSALF